MLLFVKSLFFVILFNIESKYLFSEAESRRKELDEDLTAERSAMVACADRMEEIDKEIQQVQGNLKSNLSRILIGDFILRKIKVGGEIFLFFNKVSWTWSILPYNVFN